MAERDMKLVGVKMPATLNRQLEEIARAEHNSVSAVVRRLLTAGVQRESVPQKDRLAS